MTKKRTSNKNDKKSGLVIRFVVFIAMFIVMFLTVKFVISSGVEKAIKGIGNSSNEQVDKN